MKRYKFAPMLGPADPHPLGSIQRAICMGNEFEYKAERAAERGVDDIHAVLRRVLDEQPWLVPDNPIGQTMDEYVFGCTGFTYRQLWTLVDTFKPDHGLPSHAAPTTTIRYRVGHDIHTVLVETWHDHFKDNQPGFEGWELNAAGEITGNFCWGFTSQIIPDALPPAPSEKE